MNTASLFRQIVAFQVVFAMIVLLVLTFVLHWESMRIFNFLAGVIMGDIAFHVMLVVARRKYNV